MKYKHVIANCEALAYTIYPALYQRRYTENLKPQMKCSLNKFANFANRPPPPPPNKLHGITNQVFSPFSSIRTETELSVCLLGLSYIENMPKLNTYPGLISLVNKEKLPLSCLNQNSKKFTPQFTVGCYRKIHSSFSRCHPSIQMEMLIIYYISVYKSAH